ncbi:hypothetical protein MTR_4g091095 [Medicago truncatula]|uniref:Uncharacterized protein n=1 Tax=Medicago truncatula TaxID=3880 RepID=A0A072UP40_MEDTR|nr:hypothetical protein MTR_4g091095 [Medicago truncatula]
MSKRQKYPHISVKPNRKHDSPTVHDTHTSTYTERVPEVTDIADQAPRHHQLAHSSSPILPRVPL